jgi:hypothetical protein
MNPRFIWPAVVLAGIGALTAAVMALAHVDPVVIVTILSLLVTPVLGAFLAQQLGEIKAAGAQVIQQTNGNIGRLVDLVERQGQMLAASKAPDPVPVAPLLEERQAA